MAKRKPRRFNEGDLVSDKEAGLKASAGDKVGFFERLRMGNIDQEGSEAYNRFGAGRGRAARAALTNPVYDIGYEGRDAALAVNAAPMPAAKPSDPYEVRDDNGTLSKLRRNEYGELYDPTGSTSTAPVRKPIAKPSAKITQSKPVYDYGNERTVAPRSNYSNEGRGSAAAKSLVNQIPTDRSTVVGGERTEPMSDAERNISNAMAVTGAGAAGVAGLYKLGKNMLNARKAAKAGAQKRANLKRDVEEGIERNLLDEFQNLAASAPKTAAKSEAKKNLTAERSRDLMAGQAKTNFKSPPKASDKAKQTRRFDDESNIEFKRGGSVKKKPEVKKMASGGMTSKASSRGDGIAQRGKTRGKIC